MAKVSNLQVKVDIKDSNLKIQNGQVSNFNANVDILDSSVGTINGAVSNIIFNVDVASNGIGGGTKTYGYYNGFEIIKMYLGSVEVDSFI